MAAHDRLPAALRRWLIHAALPWSAASALKIWNRAMRETGSVEAALARLSVAEQRSLRRHSFFDENDRTPKKLRSNGNVVQ